MKSFFHIREEKEPASKDEASMAERQLDFIIYAADELEEHIEKGGDFPEWMQNKLTKVHAQMESLHSAMGDHDEEEDDDDDDEEDDDDDEDKEKNESVVNEISADLAKSYHKKATAPGATKPASDAGHTKDSMRKTHNRVVGSNRAMDRMFRRDKVKGYSK